MDSDSSRLDKSLRFRDSILNAKQPRTSVHNRCTKNADDAMFLHILDCIGALSCMREEQKKSFCRENSSSSCNSNQEQASALLSCKHRVFWQAVREIADREAALKDIPATEEKKKSSALDYLLEYFPDETKQSDSRLWLPLHFAVCLPRSRLEDIETLFTANPAAIKAGADEISELNPFHLAAMTKNPRMEIIQRLRLYYLHGGSSLDSSSNTPLHLAARHSDSAAMIRELAQLHPAALEMENADGDTPLHLAAMHSDSAAMIRELAQLNPAALEMKNADGDTLLRTVLRYSRSVEVVRDLIALCPAALVTTDDEGETPLMTTINTRNKSFEFNWKLQLLLEAAPQAAQIPTLLNNLPLHDIYLKKPLSAASDVLRFLLRHCRSLAFARNSVGHTLYDDLTAGDVGFAYARRLLLMAGASSLYPGVLQKLNYAVRRQALLLFHSCVTRPSIYSRIRFSAGGPELMRTIVSFL